MKKNANIHTKILGSKSFIDDLSKKLKTFPEAVRIEDIKIEKDPTVLSFGLGEVASIVTLIQGTFFFSQLAKLIFDSIKAKKENRIVVQTPLKRIEVNSTEELSSDQIKKLLEESVKVVS